MSQTSAIIPDTGYRIVAKPGKGVTIQSRTKEGKWVRVAWFLLANDASGFLKHCLPYIFSPLVDAAFTKVSR